MDLSLYQANYSPVDLGDSPMPTRRQAPQKKKKNFWLDQISTGTGIAGGILGSFVAPVAGTAVGAGAGSALGAAIENMITGDSLGKDVAKEGALGAVFGAGPIKLAKGGLALARGAGMAGASQAALTPLRQKAGQALIGTADDLAIKQFRLTPTQLKNFQSKFKEDAGTTIRKYGFQNADDISTKGIQPLQEQFDAAITSIPGVVKTDLQKNLISKINKLSNAGPSDTQAIGGQLKKEASSLLKKYGDVIDPQELNLIRRQFDDLVNYTEKAANPARYGVNKRMADAIRETLQKADPTGQLKATGRELQKLRQLEENALKQGQLGRGSLPLNLPNLLGATVGGGAGGLPGALVGGATTQLANSNAGRRAAMRGVQNLGNRLTNAGEKAAGQSARGIATRLGTAGVATGLYGQGGQSPSLEDALLNYSSEGNNIATNAMPTNTAMMPSSANMDAQYQNMGAESSPYSRENLMMDIQRDPQNADKYIEYYSMLQEVFQPQVPEQKPLSAEASKVTSNANIGIQALNDFENAISADPSVLSKRIIPGRNALGGALGGVLGTRGADAAAQQIIDVIARLRTGAAITNDEARRFEQFIPTAGDNEQVRAQKLNYLRNQFYAVANRTSGGGSDLESALLAQQGAY